MQRKLHRLVILLLFFAASALPTRVVAEEIQERTAILDSTTKAMTQGDLAALEQLATLYRTKQARTSSGVWKLSVLHGGINRFYLLASYDKATLAEKERIAEQWVKTYPKSPTARLAYAEVLARRAWHRRGGGYANMVRAEDWAHARIYWYASQSIYDERLFTESLARWSTMRAGIDDVLKVYADEWNLQNFARFACLARDREKALELIERVRGPTYTEVWKGEENFQRCKAWVLEGVT
ncbi:hypothetical protein [uncultured Xanthomonas sp.]|uniref:hypothetical protein n=1 Tax=uncultured Xanthomonas sp. TaxID=152831 RepID=UPI0025D9EA13|nr:hypothetical protein [uncultured Xanthomonas sp.]